jgi:hypothetical protein
MAKQQVLDHLVELVRHYPAGVSVEELLQALAYAVSKRTLQYRLAQLVKTGALVVKGAGMSCKYYIQLLPQTNRKEVLSSALYKTWAEILSRSSFVAKAFVRGWPKDLHQRVRFGSLGRG